MCSIMLIHIQIYINIYRYTLIKDILGVFDAYGTRRQKKVKDATTLKL